MVTSLAKYNDAALLIIGHGRSDLPESTALIQHHARAIADHNIFDNVTAGFLKLEPFAPEQLRAIENKTVFIVPCFASPGSLTKTVIPEVLGLTSEDTQRADQTIYLAEPVGSHSRITKRLKELVQETAQVSRFEADDTTLIIIGHGSTHNPQSEIDTQNVADQLKSLSLASKVIALFLDQSPNLADWLEHCDTKNVVIASHLFSGGGHETQDVPKFLGIDPERTKERLTSKSPIGPIDVHGKQLWLCPPIGADAIVQDVIIERVSELGVP